jgi:hypothetical protein
MFSGKAVQFAGAGPTRKTLAVYSDKPSTSLRFEDLDLFGSCINARFFSSKSIAKFGKFDTRFRLAADCSYLMSIALDQPPVVTADQVFYYYRSHPKSSSLGGNLANLFVSLEEKLRIGGEFIEQGRLTSEELRHLRRAMAVQFTSTILEGLKRKRWKDAVLSVKAPHPLAFRERVILMSTGAALLTRRLVTPLT